ncbi:MAG: hypothetical protein LBM00_06010 [Deltaproteobacteria bacterium]|jgi:hypothetical protein|nr:hypothetical protein [Deltaproteobacteria bacterium]
MSEDNIGIKGGGPDSGAEVKGGEPAGETLLTGLEEKAEENGEGGKAGNADKDASAKDRAGGTSGGDKAKSADGSGGEVPDTPEGYKLKFAETVRPDEELLGNFKQTAHELGLSLKQAQRLSELYIGHAVRLEEKALDSQTSALLAARKQWESEIKKSASFEQDKSLARKALKRFGNQELYDLLDQTNLGAHPRMFSFMAEIGKALAEPGFKGNSAAREEKSIARILYPEMN